MATDVEKLKEDIIQFFHPIEDVELVYLFGSYADGTSCETSDLDIGVYFKDHPEISCYLRSAELIPQLQVYLRLDEIDVVLLNVAAPRIKNEVIKGTCLLSRNHWIHDEFERRTLREWMDFEPYDLFQREVIFKQLKGEQVTLDILRIEEYLFKLKECLENLEEWKKYGRSEFKKNAMLHAAVKRNLQLSVECIFDIGKHILSTRYKKRISYYAEVVPAMEEVGILPSDLADNLKQISGFRNKIVHDYIKYDLDIVYDTYQEHLDDLQQFLQIMVKVVEQVKKSD